MTYSESRNKGLLNFTDTHTTYRFITPTDHLIGSGSLTIANRKPMRMLFLFQHERPPSPMPGVNKSARAVYGRKTPSVTDMSKTKQAETTSQWQTRIRAVERQVEHFIFSASQFSLVYSRTPITHVCLFGVLVYMHKNKPI